MSARVSALGLVVVAALGSGSAARAADLDSFYGQPGEPEALPPQDFTFGSGWYLRGDATGADDLRHNLGRLADRSDRDNWTYGVGGGVGYQFTSYLRADLTADYFGKERMTYADGIGDVFKSTLHRYDVLGNAYFDLGTWAGFSPYVGAGVGFAGVSSDLASTSAITGRTDRFSYGTRYNLAWAAMAGIGYHVSPNLLIDVGYRYLDLGDYAPVPGAKSRTLESHQVRAGLRYMIY